MNTIILIFQDKDYKYRKYFLLLAGTILLIMANLRFNISILAWLTPVPFLLFLRENPGKKNKLLFLVILFSAWSIAILKIITDPLPAFFTFLYSLPIAVIQGSGYILWDRIKNYKMSFLTFPAIMVIMEWMQFSFTPFATWGNISNTQLENLVLLQGLSLFGMPGISFLIYYIAALIEKSISDNVSKKQWLLAGLTLIAVYSYGSIRLSLWDSKDKQNVTVAAIGTDSKIGGPDFPSKNEIITVQKNLFKRTKKAAQSGAQVIVWTEAATLVFPDQEKIWQQKLSKLSSELKIYLFASYVVLKSKKPILYENKWLAWFPNGNRAASPYLKHEPVPGEPAVKGKGLAPVVNTPYGSISPAICYDYNFPYLGLNHAKQKVDIVTLPSSDWKGIDPIHTQMAAFRAIEGGHSIIRSTRWGLSAAIDPYGRFRAWRSDFDKGEKILMSALPIKGIQTLYSKIGDLFILFAFTLIILSVYHTKLKKR